MLLLGVLAGCPAAGAQEADAFFGRRVVSLAFQSDGPVLRSALEELVEIPVGQPLTPEGTGETIRNLFATRRFADVRVEAVPEGDGVAITIRLLRSALVEKIGFEGRLGLSREVLRRAIPFAEGSVFSADQVEAGAASLRRRLSSDGFVRASVTPRTAFDALGGVEVTYAMDAGERARVARALFDGETAPFTAEQLQREARLDPGDRYRETRALSDATRIREFLHDAERLKANVELIAAQPTDDGRIMPVYRIFVGPKVVFDVRGLRARKVRREVRDLLEGQVFDEDLILQYVERKRRDLQQQGYYRADVSYSLEEKEDDVLVRVTVGQGQKFSIESVEIDGNASIEDDRLEELVITRKRGLPLVAPGRLVDGVLEDDVEAILGLYQTRGWIDAEVGPARVAAGSRPDRLAVTIPVREGVRTMVASRSLTGAEQFSASDLEPLLTVRAGEPLNLNALRQDAAALQARYRDSGFREVSVEEDYALSPDRSSASVTYRIDEGLRSFFGDTIVRGNVRTDTERIRRLVSWREGRPFSDDALLQTQRHLTRTGVFRTVRMLPAPADSDRTRNVEIELQEGRPLSLLYGFGYQFAPEAIENRNDPFLVGGASYNNLFGRMQSAGLEGQVSLSGRYRLQLSFREPFLFGREYPFTAFFFATREPISRIDLDRFGFVNEVSHLYGKYLRVSLRAEYQRIEPVNPEDVSRADEELRRSDQPIEEATIGPIFFYDRRDDVIDPHRGYYVNAFGKYAFPVLSAKAQFAKFSWQAAAFQPVGGSVVAVSARVGGIFPGHSDNPVPLAERFFAGGRTTNRAFQTDLLGIPADPDPLPGDPPQATVDYETRATLRDDENGDCATAYPNRPDPNLRKYDCDFGPRIIGGNGFLALNAEMRFPIFGNLGGTVFYDAAQVWREFSSVHFGFGEDGLRQGVGIGLRYMLPVGPLRVEYAWKLNRRTIDFNVVDVTPEPSGEPTSPFPFRDSTRESPGQFFLSLGYPF